MTQWPGHRKLSCVIISSHHTVLVTDLVTINQGERKLIFALSTLRAALCFPNDSLDKLSQLKSIIHIFALSTVIMSNVIVPAAHLQPHTLADCGVSESSLPAVCAVTASAGNAVRSRNPYITPSS